MFWYSRTLYTSLVSIHSVILSKIFTFLAWFELAQGISKFSLACRFQPCLSKQKMIQHKRTPSFHVQLSIYERLRDFWKRIIPTICFALLEFPTHDFRAKKDTYSTSICSQKSLFNPLKVFYNLPYIGCMKMQTWKILMFWKAH